MTKSDYYKYLKELPNYEDEYIRLFENPEYYIPLDKALEYIIKQDLHIGIYTQECRHDCLDCLDLDYPISIDTLIKKLEEAKKNNYTEVIFEMDNGAVYVCVESEVRVENSKVAKQILKTIVAYVKSYRLYLYYKIEQLEKQLNNN